MIVDRFDGPSEMTTDDYQYSPSNVDINKCGHSTDEPHYCVHDGRIVFNNLERQQERS